MAPCLLNNLLKSHLDVLPVNTATDLSKPLLLNDIQLQSILDLSTNSRKVTGKNLAKNTAAALAPRAFSLGAAPAIQDISASIHAPEVW